MLRFRSALALVSAILLFHAAARAASDPPVQIFELPAPRPTQAPSPVPGIASGLTVDDGDTHVDHFLLRFSVMNGVGQTRRLELEGGGKSVRGAVAVDGYGAAQALPYGQVDIGTAQRFGVLGEQEDPLAGLVFYPVRSTGAAYVDAPAGTAWFDVQRNYGEHFIGGSRSVGDRTFTFAASPSQPFKSALFGMRETTQSDGVAFTKEFWAGPGGFAAGALYRTSGRLFFESADAFATKGMPVGIDDLPRRMNAGYSISPALTLRGGIASAYRIGTSAYLSAALQTHNTSATVTQAWHNTSLSIATRDQNGFAELSYASAPFERDLLADGGHVLGSGQVDVLATVMQNGYSDARLEWRSQRSASSLLFGFESERQRGVRAFAGPLIGFSVPFNRDLSTQFEVRPTLGRQAVRVSFAQRIDVSVHRKLRPTTVVAPYAIAQLRYFLDDALCAAPGGKIAVPAGDHTLIVASADYSLSSLPLAVRGGMPAVDAPLYPVRSITGRIVVSDPQDFVQAPELDGIEVQLVPGTATTTTQADGSFKLPPAPVAPGAQIVIVSDSLPDGLSDEGPIVLTGDAPADLPVRASRRIETTRLPSGGSPHARKQRLP